jgi:hypothetical protein
MFGRLFGAWLLAAGLFVAPAEAMEGMSGMDNSCMLMAGMHEMHFSGYQTKSALDEFCQDIPSAGSASITIDAIDKNIRDMTTEVRIIRGLGPEEGKTADLGPVTIKYLPPTQYPGGTFTFPVDFDQPGKYTAIVTVRSPDEAMAMTGQLVLTVGQMANQKIFVAGGICVLILLASAAYLRSSFRHKKTA